MILSNQPVDGEFYNPRESPIGTFVTELWLKGDYTDVVLFSADKQFRFWPSEVALLEQIASQYGVSVIQIDTTSRRLRFPGSLNRQKVMSFSNAIIERWVQLLVIERRRSTSRTRSTRPGWSPYYTPSDRANQLLFAGMPKGH